MHLERSLSAYPLERLLDRGSGGDVQVGVEDLREPMQQIEDFVLKCAGLKESAPVMKLAVVLTNARSAIRSAGLDAAR